MERGKFITLEGGEGAGKSTQAVRLAAYLEKCGKTAIVTREPGGTDGAEEIRELWLKRDWDPMTGLLLTMAARREHLVDKIWPALEKGVWVVSDRFVDSARVYQGMADNLGMEKVDEVYRVLSGGFEADMTLLLDVSVEKAARRLHTRKDAANRYDLRDGEYHEKLRSAFLDLAEKEPNRFFIIEAEADEGEVEKKIISAVRSRFDLPDK